MGFQPQLSTRTTTDTRPYNNGDDDHSISSTISVNRNNKQPSYKICNTPTYSDGFQLVQYSNTTEITPVIAPPLPPQPPKSHLPSATPRPANAHHQPRKWNQSKLGFFVIPNQHVPKTPYTTPTTTVENQWKSFSTITDPLNIPQQFYVSTAPNKITHKSPTDSNRTSRVQNQFSCLSDDEDNFTTPHHHNNVSTTTGTHSHIHINDTSDDDDSVVTVMTKNSRDEIQPSPHDGTVH